MRLGRVSKAVGGAGKRGVGTSELRGVQVKVPQGEGVQSPGLQSEDLEGTLGWIKGGWERTLEDCPVGARCPGRGGHGRCPGGGLGGLG